MQDERTPTLIPAIVIEGDLPDGRAGYDVLISAGAAQLEQDEWWVIDHDEGTLWDTASKRFDAPVMVFCEAVGCDWDEATDSGYRLARLKRKVPDAG